MTTLTASPPGATHPTGGRDTPWLVGVHDFRAFRFRRDREVLVPIGQERVARRVLRAARTRTAIVEQLRAEYRSIIDALWDMHVPFRVLNLDHGDPEIARWLRATGCTSLRFPGSTPLAYQLFPRDLFVYLKHAGVLLVHPDVFRLRSSETKGCEIIHTPLAEGGRVLFAGDRMLIGRHPEGRCPSGEAATIRRLRARGMRIAEIPYPLCYQLSPHDGGDRMALAYDSHLDRSASLIQGTSGLSLVLDPGYRTGPLLAPLSGEQSIALVRAACERIEVSVRVPPAGGVPYATSAVQVQDGKVLVSGGHPDLLAVIAELCEPGRVHATARAIEAYPVFAAAGLHCVVTESPVPLLAG